MIKQFCINKYAAPRWTEDEKILLKAYFVEQRDKGIAHNIIYQNLADRFEKSFLSVKQMLERMYKTDEDLKEYKYESWNREKIVDNIKELYNNGEPVNRLALPRKVRWQVDNHSLPKSELRGYETWWNSADDAIAEAIYEVGFRRDQEGNLSNENPINDMSEAKIYFQRMNKLSHRWSIDEIKGLLQEAHEAGLPLTLSFLAKHPDIYKPLLNVNRSLEGLKDTIKRLGVSWSDLVLDVAPEYREFYSESGKINRSTEEIRVQRFLELNNVSFELGSRMAVEDPELVALGYKHFVPDFVIIDEENNLPVAFVEVFGSILDSQAANTAEIYNEKMKAKYKYFSQLPLNFIPINNNNLGNDLSNETLMQKFAPYIKEEELEQVASLSKQSGALTSLIVSLLLSGASPSQIVMEYKVPLVKVIQLQKEMIDAEMNKVEAKVIATIYHPVRGQTDATPHITADNSEIDVKNVPTKPGERIVALSRDLLGNNIWHQEWKGPFEFGDIIEVSGAGQFDGLWVVRDTMNLRFKNRMDFLVPEEITGGVFTKVKIRKIGHAGEKYMADIHKESSLYRIAPFESLKQEKWMQINKPEMWKRWYEEHGHHLDWPKKKKKSSVKQFAKIAYSYKEIMKERIREGIKKQLRNYFQFGTVEEFFDFIKMNIDSYIQLTYDDEDEKQLISELLDEVIQEEKIKYEQKIVQGKDKPPFSTPRQQLYLKKNVPEVYESWKDRFGPHEDYDKYVKERGGESLIPPSKEYRKKKKKKFSQYISIFDIDQTKQRIEEMIDEHLKDKDIFLTEDELIRVMKNELSMEMIELMDPYDQLSQEKILDIYEVMLLHKVRKWQFQNDPESDPYIPVGTANKIKGFCKVAQKSIILYRAEPNEVIKLTPSESEKAMHLSTNNKIAKYYATREGDGFIYTVKIPLDDQNLQEGAGKSEYLYWGEIPDNYIVNKDKVSKDEKVELDYGRDGYESTNTNLPSGRYYNTPYDGSV